MAHEWRIGVAPRRQSASRRASDLAVRQFGTVARRQLLEVGFSPSRVDRWLRDGRLHCRYPGVYAWGRAELTVRGEMAAPLLYAGRGSALGGLSALWWEELLTRRPSLTCIDSASRRDPQPGLRIRHVGTVERRWHRELPLVALPLALLTAAEALSPNAMRLVLARAEFKQVLSLSSLLAAVAEGRPGSRALRAAMDAHLPQLARCANGFEREFVLLCERFGVPLPEPNLPIGRYRPDMLWREARLAVELDGRAAHSTPAQHAADAHRQAELERMGFTVIRFGWEDVSQRPEWVAKRVREALAAPHSAGRSIRHIRGPLGISSSPITS